MPNLTKDTKLVQTRISDSDYSVIESLAESDCIKIAGWLRRHTA